MSEISVIEQSWRDQGTKQVVPVYQNLFWRNNLIIDCVVYILINNIFFLVISRQKKTISNFESDGEVVHGRIPDFSLSPVVVGD